MQVNEEMPVTLSESAILHFKRSLESSPTALGIRLGVKNRGCSGLSYVIDFATQISEQEDCIFQCEEILLVMDKKSLAYLQGMHIDCVQEGLNAHLKFSNPNAKGECGCGESFTTE